MALEDIEELLEGLRTGSSEATSALSDVNEILGSLSSTSTLTSGVLSRLSDSMRQNAAAEAAAAALGTSAAEVKKALAAETKAQADAEKKAAEASKAHAEILAGVVTSAGNMAANAIKAVGAAALSIATGPIPNATQAGVMLGQALGGAITSATDKAAEALSKLGPAGEIAAAALQAFGAVAAATVGTLLTLTGIAVDVVQKLDMMRDRFAALAGSAAGGRAVQAMLENLNLPFAKEQVESWGQALLAAGVKGKQLEADVKAVAAATALMGQSGGAAAETLFKRLGEGGPAADKLLKTFVNGGPKADKLLKEMGLSLGDLGGQAAVAKMTTEQLHEALAKAMAKKGAGPLADLGLTLPVILTKAREGFLSLFDKLGGPVKALMKEVKSLFGEFNKGGSVINGLKPTVTAVLTSVIGWIKAGVVAAHELIQGFMGTGKAKGPFAEIGAQIRRITDAAGRLISAFEKLDKSKPGQTSASFAALAFIIQGVADVLTDLMNNATAAMMVIDNLGAIVDDAGSALSGLADGAIEAASNFVAGLVDGISAGVGAVVDAVKGLATSALGAFTGAMKIRSPSAIMLEHGEDNIAGAAATGMDKGRGKVKAAAARMADEAKPGNGKAGANGGGDGGPSILFQDCTFNGTDETLIRKVIYKALAAWAGQAGAAQPETT